AMKLLASAILLFVIIRILHFSFRIRITEDEVIAVLSLEWRSTNELRYRMEILKGVKPNFLRGIDHKDLRTVLRRLIKKGLAEARWQDESGTQYRKIPPDKSLEYVLIDP
ncbi:MAG: hypothetical protein KW802_04165, partial [Candidatus Doudnabacteria bacterium]|nr:hypothetical protein [Candidatus Doudnabacteria bacterium]